jgi:hypothetical protein
MKKIMLGVCLIGSMTMPVFASDDTEDKRRKEQEEINMKMLAELGLPLPGSGIKLSPRVALGGTEAQLKQAQLEQEEMANQGYISKYTTRPKELLNINNEIKKQNRLFAASVSNSQFTGIRPDVKNLKLAFKLKSIKERPSLKSFVNSNQIIMLGAAPQGGFHEDKGGWSGAGQFFTIKNIGTCVYSVMNVKASNTAAELALEDVTYKVNDKPTINRVEGNTESGFIYKVEWYDNNNFHDLECANMKFSTETNESVISLAKRIDH